VHPADVCLLLPMCSRMLQGQPKQGMQQGILQHPGPVTLLRSLRQGKVPPAVSRSPLLSAPCMTAPGAGTSRHIGEVLGGGAPSPSGGVCVDLQCLAQWWSSLQCLQHASKAQLHRVWAQPVPLCCKGHVVHRACCKSTPLTPMCCAITPACCQTAHRKQIRALQLL
jgi:hypothetical protein